MQTGRTQATGIVAGLTCEGVRASLSRMSAAMLLGAEDVVPTIIRNHMFHCADCREYLLVLRQSYNIRWSWPQDDGWATVE